MSPVLTFKINGLENLLLKLDGPRFDRALSTTTRGIAEILKGYLAKAPGKVHKPIEWASEKQRRWYFATRRKAGLGAYRRNSDPWSQRIGPSWATENTGPRNVNAVVGTRVTYAPYVQSAEFQQPMHRNTGWITDQQAIDRAQLEDVAQKVWAKVFANWNKG